MMKVVFSDESRICVGPVNISGIFVWKQKGEEYGGYCSQTKLKFPTSIMMWGCMCGQDIEALTSIIGRINQQV